MIKNVIEHNNESNICMIATIYLDFIYIDHSVGIKLVEISSPLSSMKSHACLS